MACFDSATPGEGAGELIWRGPQDDGRDALARGLAKEGGHDRDGQGRKR